MTGKICKLQQTDKIYVWRVEKYFCYEFYANVLVKEPQLLKTQLIVAVLPCEDHAGKRSVKHRHVCMCVCTMPIENKCLKLDPTPGNYREVMGCLTDGNTQQ